MNVSILRNFPQAGCRFLLRDGKFTRMRSCSRPAGFFRAGGTGRWQLKLGTGLPRGAFLIRVEAVDAGRSHSRRSSAAAQRISVR